LAINSKSSRDIFANKVHFVTFNYDVSLDRALHQGLRHIQLFEPENIAEFLDVGRVMHVYGKVREDPSGPPPALNWSEQSRDPQGLGPDALAKYFSDYKTFLDQIYAASQGIRVIDPKKTDKDVIDAATKSIAKAERVYILGYFVRRLRGSPVMEPQETSISSREAQRAAPPADGSGTMCHR
jgi:hypothetical protein